MNKQTEALKMAIKALLIRHHHKDLCDEAIEACKEALTEAELDEMQAITAQEYYTQEPVALKFPTMLRKMWSGTEVQEWLDKQPPLYTHPAIWQSLSDDEIDEVFNLGHKTYKEFAHALLNKAKEKNHPCK